MEYLAREISEALRKSGHYTIRPGQLSRLWPAPPEEQEAKIKEFAERHGWQLYQYNYGVGARIVESKK